MVFDFPLIFNLVPTPQTENVNAKYFRDASHDHVAFKYYNPRDLNIKTQNNQELVEQAQPINRDGFIPFNSEQLEKSKSDFELQNFYTAWQNSGSLFTSNERPKKIVPLINYNADFLAIASARALREQGVLVKQNDDGTEEPSFVLVTHGHSCAIVAEMSTWTQDRDCEKPEALFDTSIYMPQGDWSANHQYAGLATLEQQIWGDYGEVAKKKVRTAQWTLANGIAVALNGHRGERLISVSVDEDKKDEPGLAYINSINIETEAQNTTANIDAEKMLGTAQEFYQGLKARGLSRVVIGTEHYLPYGQTINEPNILSLEDLKTSGSKTFDDSNKDLYEYFKNFSEQYPDIELIVVGIDGRVTAEAKH